MQKLTLTIAITLLSLVGMAQTKVTKDANGNYVTVKRVDTSASKLTGKTITYRDGKSYPVYISVNDKLYYLRTSKAGNVYKSYIKEN